MSPSTVYDWLHRHPLLVDAVLAAGLLLACGTATASQAGWVGIPLTLGMVAPLALRRRAPSVVCVVVALACLAQLPLTSAPVPSNIGVLFALYAVAAYGRARWVRHAALGLGLLGAALATWDWVVEGPSSAVVFAFLMLCLLVVATWVLGDLMRNRRAVVNQLRAQNRALERERDQRARLAAEQERSRIAREMHDVVAHSLSVIVVQADGGGYAARHAGADAPALNGCADAAALAAAADTLDTVASTARQALAETRRLVGVLREERSSAELVPQAGLDDLESLIDRVRGSGVGLAHEVRGAPRQLPRGVELAAYRVVQESLTNVLKHAGPGARAQVGISYLPERVEIRVVDNGRGASAPDDRNGNGLMGMAERVAVYSGTLQAGPRPEGGFAVTATIPTTEEPA